MRKLWIFMVIILPSFAAANSVSDTLSWLENHGFPFARARLDSSGAIQVDRGSAWVWAPLRLLDSGSTGVEVLQRLSLLEPGAPVRMRDLERSRRLLLRTGWFSKVGEYRIFRAPGRNLLVPALAVTQEASNQVEAWGSLQNDAAADSNSWEGRLLLDLQNLAGTGRCLRVVAERGANERRAELTWREPYILGSPWNATLYGGISQIDSTQENVWAHLETTTQLDFEWSSGVGAQVEKVREDSNTVEQRRGTLSIMRDGRDRLPLARQGWMWNLNVQAGQRIPQTNAADTSQAVAQATSSLGLWWPLGRHVGVSQEGEWGRIWCGHPQGLLTGEVYALGGNKLKGYWPASLHAIAFVREETRLLWNMENSQAFLFAEGARLRELRARSWAWRTSYGIGWQQQQRGLGVGLQLAWRDDAAARDALLGVSVQNRW